MRRLLISVFDEDFESLQDFALADDEHPSVKEQATYLLHLMIQLKRRNGEPHPAEALA